MMSPLAPARDIPTYRIAFELPKSRRFAVCVFVINEGERIRRQLSEMKSYASSADIIIADGGSTDGSFDGSILQDNDVNTLLVKEGPGKLSAQMRMAFSYALDRGYEGIVAIDGNGKDGVEAIPRFLKLLDDGYDHLQGSRYIEGGHHENTPASRHWGVCLLHAPVISLAAGFRYTDTTNGFRGYSRRFLEDPRVQPFRSCFVAYELHYYLAIRAARLGFRCLEVPVSRIYPKAEKVPTKISPIKGNLQVLRTLFAAAFHRFDPPV